MSNKSSKLRASHGLLMRSGKLLPAEQVPGTDQFKSRQAKVDAAVSLKKMGVVVVGNPEGGINVP